MLKNVLVSRKDIESIDAEMGLDASPDLYGISSNELESLAEIQKEAEILLVSDIDRVRYNPFFVEGDEEE